MANQITSDEIVPNFPKNGSIHGVFGVLEYFLILITIFVYNSNMVFLIVNLIIVSALFSLFEYVVIFKNPYYYIAGLGLICITIFPSTISLIIYTGSTSWSYEPIKLFIIPALVLEAVYIIFSIMDISHNKYISYFHRRYGNLRQTVLRPSHYSVKEFDKFDKGRQYWQDHPPEEIQKRNEELREYNKRFKKNFLISAQILCVISFIISFSISLV